MASLYDQIRKPWAAWEMTMEGHDPAGEPNGVQLLADGDMEAAGTASWIANSGAVLSKQNTDPHSGTQNLRITTLNGDNQSQARQDILTAGGVYRATGYYRTDGVCDAYIWAYPSTFVLLPAVLTWTPFDIILYPTNALLFLASRYIPADQEVYSEFDDVRVELMPPRVLDVSGNGRHLTIGDGAGSNEPTKLVQKRGYRNAGTNYLNNGSLTWSSNRITVEALIQLYQRDAAGYLLDMRDTSGTPIQAVIIYTAGALYVYIGGAVVGNSAKYTINPQMGITHVVGRYNGTTTELFINGQSVDSALTPVAPGAGSTGIDIFRRRLTGIEYAGCDMHLCRIWDVALTDVQIRELSRRAKQELTRI